MNIHFLLRKHIETYFSLLTGQFSHYPIIFFFRQLDNGRWMTFSYWKIRHRNIEFRLEMKCERCLNYSMLLANRLNLLCPFETTTDNIVIKWILWLKRQKKSPSTSYLSAKKKSAKMCFNSLFFTTSLWHGFGLCDSITFQSRQIYYEPVNLNFVKCLQWPHGNTSIEREMKIESIFYSIDCNIVRIANGLGWNGKRKKKIQNNNWKFDALN